MTDKERLSAIRAEIERKKKWLNAPFTKEANISAIEVCDLLISFVDSLLEEAKNNDLEEEIRKYNDALNLDANMDYSWDDIAANVVLAARYFTNWQKQKMMNGVIKAKCFGMQNGKALFSIHLPAKDYLIGSEVKLIIIN